jgi:hypothetical protein
MSFPLTATVTERPALVAARATSLPRYRSTTAAGSGPAHTVFVATGTNACDAPVGSRHSSVDGLSTDSDEICTAPPFASPPMPSLRDAPAAGATAADADPAGAAAAAAAASPRFACEDDIGVAERRAVAVGVGSRAGLPRGNRCRRPPSPSLEERAEGGSDWVRCASSCPRAVAPTGAATLVLALL